MEPIENRKNRRMSIQNRQVGAENPATIFQIQKKEIISITGSGGKTTLLFCLAAELRKRGSVLLTTSTKIAVPQSGFDFLYTSLSAYQDAVKTKKAEIFAETGLTDASPKNAASSLWGNTVTCLGEKVPGIAKLTTVGYKALCRICSDFDYCLIEADGSRRLPLKFWKAYEPVIYDFSTKAIGILPIKVYGKVPSADFIYNFEGYQAYIGQEPVNGQTIAQLLAYPEGLFKNFFGPRYILINQVETEEDFKHFKEVQSAFRGTEKLVYGSAKEGIFYED